MTPQNLLGSGQTPHSLLASPAVHNDVTSCEPSSGHTNLYAPVASPAPPSPMPPTPMNQLSASTSAPSMEPGIVPQLQNIVSTVNLACPLDLKKIALHARNAEYNPKRLAARKYARIIQKLGFLAKFKDFKIQNKVGSCDV